MLGGHGCWDAGALTGLSTGCAANGVRRVSVISNPGRHRGLYCLLVVTIYVTAGHRWVSSTPHKPLQSVNMNIAAIGENQYYAVLKFSLVSLENVKGGHGNTRIMVYKKHLIRNICQIAKQLGNKSYPTR